MDKLKAAARTSEFWVAIAAGVVTALVQGGVIPQEAGDSVNAMIVYALARVASKAVKAV